MVHRQPTRTAMTERDPREAAPGRAKAHWPECGRPEPAPLGCSWSVAPRADAVVSGLRSSSMFALAVQVYRVHQRDCAGRCRSCASQTCRSRVHAAIVIAAAGASPADFDTPVRCGLRRPSGLRRLTTAPGSPVRVMVARGVRSRPSPECRGRTRPHVWSGKSPRDRPHSREVLKAVRRPPASLATDVSACIDLVRLACSTDAYPLRGLLFCRCGARFCRWGSPGTTREYMTVCGCRLRPIDADTIERRVYTDAARLVPALAAGRWCESPAEVLARLYARIEVGGTVDDVRFVRRT